MISYTEVELEVFPYRKSGGVADTLTISFQQAMELFTHGVDIGTLGVCGTNKHAFIFILILNRCK